MKSSTVFGVLSTAALACAAVLAPDDPNHKTPLPTRPLTWGDVNVLHTTDIHGWILGHPKKVYPEMSWSGTFGDFYSFVHHMRGKAQRQRKDLFLVDTGDRRIGHGLTDKLLDPQRTVNGQLVSELYIKLGYDVVVPGNHDLINDNVVKYAIEKLAELWDGRYLTSNIRLNMDHKENKLLALRSRTKNEEWPFLGAPYRYWKTKNKKNVLAFGVVLNKKGLYSDRIAVTNVVDMVEEEWFKGALRLPVDVFMVLGHIDPEKPADSDNMKHIYDAIRSHHPFTPIMMFGGHTHKRYCLPFKTSGGSTRSMLLQSGHYFDTVGWMSAKLDDNKSDKDLVMTRRYLDNNVDTYMYHTQKRSLDTFHMKTGITIANYVYGIDRAEGLSQVFGYLESSYFLDRKKWTEAETDPESLFSLYLNASPLAGVEDMVIYDDESRRPWMFVSNWGILRGDIYSGAFTLGDLYTISPNDKKDYLYVKVKRSVADALVGQLQKPRSRLQDRDRQLLRAPIANKTMSSDGSQAQFSLGGPKEPSGLTYGLKTTDKCGDNGDDIEHEPIPQVALDGSDGSPEVYFWRKSWRTGPVPPEDAEVDLIVTNYIGLRRVPGALKSLTGEDITLQPYRPDGVKQDELLGVYIRKKFGTITKNIPLPQ